MAQHGWTVTAVDLVQRAIDKAKEKSARAGVEIRFLRGDVTQLGKDGAGSGFDLIEDSGCLHGLPDHLRDAYVREVTAAAAARATLLIFGFTRAKRRRGPQGVERDEIERRFGRDWELVWSGLQKEASNVPDDPIYGYELRRRSA
jgi:cyclopropane fatty-acyl-phospholipid synthase-like methyltransferase